MENQTNSTPITPESFRDRYDQLERLINGKSKEIAKRAGVNIHRFYNCRSGRIISEELIRPIYEAMEEVAMEEMQKIEI